jgi:hypothetical protein
LAGRLAINTIVSDGGFVYLLTYFTVEKDKDYSDIYAQMLSTFRFNTPLATPGVNIPFRVIKESEFITDYSGSAVVSGEYYIGNDGILGNLVCFTPDSSSKSLLPLDRYFCFSNQETALGAFRVRTDVPCSYSGLATIAVEGYQDNRIPGEVVNTSKLNKVISMTGPVETCWHVPTEPFSSRYFTLSFRVPKGFGVIDLSDSIYVFQEPHKTREIGDDNSFMRLTRYSQSYTRQTAEQQFRASITDASESKIYIDGSFFTRIGGTDNGSFEGDSAGKVIAIFFEKSVLLILERPLNEKQAFDPIQVGLNILQTFRFAK